MSNPKHIKRAIFDSGPLLLALTINFINKNNIQNFDKILQNAYDKIKNIQNPKRTLENFFSHFTRIYTTSHAIGELIGLVKSRLDFNVEYENKFWGNSIDYLKSKNLSEELIKFIELKSDIYYQELISSIGFVDTELIKLAIEHKFQLPIISIDSRTLKREANKKTIDVFILEDDIYSFIN